MHALRTDNGMPVLSFDEAQAEPEIARSLMRGWLRGAGGTAPSLGMGGTRLPAKPAIIEPAGEEPAPVEDVQIAKGLAQRDTDRSPDRPNLSKRP